VKYPQTAEKTNVLILSDDRAAKRSLYEMLCRNGYSVNLSDSIEATLAHIEEDPRQIILTDMHATGIELLKEVEKTGYTPPIIILTSYGNIEVAIESIKMGAFDYLVKPVEDKKIISVIERASAKIPPISKERPLTKGSPKVKGVYYGLVGDSPQVKNIYSMVDRIANTKATVLLYGESGTGKRMIARAIHQADDQRREKPFIEVSCGALPREIIESELFGHTKGSFTGAIIDRKGRFELAHGGTMLLDDIDSFSLELQVKLLRVLQEREFERVGDHKTMKVDVRIIASTNQDLKKAVAEGRFREDLYYRLNVISITIPPLRERKEDLRSLMGHFVSLYSEENHKKIKDISQETLNILANYNWPGNIRELENIIERAVILDTDNVIDKDDLPEIIFGQVAQYKAFASLKDVLKEPEKVHILKVLKEVGGNKKKAASKLGVNRTTLYNKLRQYEIVSDTNK